LFFPSAVVWVLDVSTFLSHFCFWTTL
jgi:hypothetical protein